MSTQSRASKAAAVRRVFVSRGACARTARRTQFERSLITEDGPVTNPSVEKFLSNHMADFHAFIARVSSVMPRTT